jgi:GNAT superfamily N-acetyltransferase
MQPTHTSRNVLAGDAEQASQLVQQSFLAFVAPDWSAEACAAFRAESSPAAFSECLASPAYAAASFSSGGTMVGFILMPKPSLLSMLFVRPGSLRLGIGRQLWERARAHIEDTHPSVKTVELNASPYAVAFYRSVGFVQISAEFRREGCRATRMACWLPAKALGAEVP